MSFRPPRGSEKPRTCWRHIERSDMFGKHMNTSCSHKLGSTHKACFPSRINTNENQRGNNVCIKTVSPNIHEQSEFGRERKKSSVHVLGTEDVAHRKRVCGKHWKDGWIDGVVGQVGTTGEPMGRGEHTIKAKQ